MTKTSITGRDGYIQTKALVYAIGQIQSLPDHKQEWSDMYDMCQLLRAHLGPAELASYAVGVEWHTGNPVNLFPEDGEDLSAKDKEFKSSFERARLKEYQRRDPSTDEFLETLEASQFPVLLLSMTSPRAQKRPSLS